MKAEEVYAKLKKMIGLVSVGISSTTSTKNPDGSTTITINFSSGSPLSFTMSPVKGDKGVGIKDALIKEIQNGENKEYHLILIDDKNNNIDAGKIPVSSGGIIDDKNVSNKTTYSSVQIENKIKEIGNKVDELKKDLVNILNTAYTGGFEMLNKGTSILELNTNTLNTRIRSAENEWKYKQIVIKAGTKVKCGCNDGYKYCLQLYYVDNELAILDYEWRTSEFEFCYEKDVYLVCVFGNTSDTDITVDEISNFYIVKETKISGSINRIDDIYNKLNLRKVPKKNIFDLHSTSDIVVNSSGTKRNGLILEGLDGKFVITFDILDYSASLAYKFITENGEFTDYTNLSSGDVIDVKRGNKLLIYTSNIDPIRHSFKNIQLERGLVPTEYEEYTEVEVADTFSTESKNALLAILEELAWATQNGEQLIEAFKKTLYV